MVKWVTGIHYNILLCLTMDQLDNSGATSMMTATFKVVPSVHKFCPDIYFEMSSKFVNVSEMCKYYARSLDCWTRTFQFASLMQSWKLHYGEDSETCILVLCTDNEQHQYKASGYTSMVNALGAMSEIKHLLEFPEGIYMHHYFIPFLVTWLNPISVFATMSMITHRDAFAIDLDFSAPSSKEVPSSSTMTKGRKKATTRMNSMKVYDLSLEMSSNPKSHFYKDNYPQGYRYTTTFSKCAATKLIKQFPKARMVGKEMKYNSMKCNVKSMSKQLESKFADVLQVKKRNRMFKIIVPACSAEELVGKMDNYISSECC